MTVPPYRTSVDIAARPEAVYPYLTRAEAIVTWMGDYAVLDAQPGGGSMSTSTAFRSAASSSSSTRRTAC
jgi:uncharacterized protein YndB with AHSA1/START domain